MTAEDGDMTPAFVLDSSEKKESVGQPFIFQLDGVRYPFTPTDTGGMLAAYLERDGAESLYQMTQWLQRGMDEDSFSEIMAKLKDPDDPFDMINFRALIEGLLEVFAKRPTIQRSGSLGSQKKIGNSSTGVRSRKGMTRKGSK